MIVWLYGKHGLDWVHWSTPRGQNAQKNPVMQIYITVKTDLVIPLLHDTLQLLDVDLTTPHTGSRSTDLVSNQSDLSIGVICSCKLHDYPEMSML